MVVMSVSVSQFMLAVIFVVSLCQLSPQNISADDSTAATIDELEEDSKSGSADARIKLALCYLNGKNGVSRNEYKAFSLYKLVAEKSESVDAKHERLALNYLGYMCEHGIGVDRDLNQAFSYYLKAASKNSGRAMYSISIFYLKGMGPLEKDAAIGAALLEVLAKADYRPAMTYLGTLYTRGEGVEKNPGIAFKWFEKSAMTGDSWGQLNLGLSHLGGYGVAKDTNEGIKWLERSADLGNVHAMRHLAYALMRLCGSDELSGERTEERENLKRVTMLLQTAARLGDEESTAVLNSGFHIRTNAFQIPTSFQQERELKIWPKSVPNNINYVDRFGAVRHSFQK